MDPGKIAVLAGLITSVLAISFYALSLRGNKRLLWAARGAYLLTGAAVFAAAGRLMWLVVNQQFVYKYVYQFTSPDLKFPFTYAATWAGQEGSFLLWSFWTV